MGAGFLTGLLSTLPFVLTYLALMAFYPSEDVFRAAVPWLVMLDRVGAAGLGRIYTVVVFFTLVETGIDLIHALLGRINSVLREYDLPELNGRQRALFTVGILSAAALLSRFGLVALVAQGYTALAYGFLVLFALPLLTVGVKQIARARNGGRLPPP